MERPYKKPEAEAVEGIARPPQDSLAAHAKELNSQLDLIKFQESGGFPMITALEVKPLIERSLEIMQELTSGSGGVELDEDALRQELSTLREEITRRNPQLLKEMGEIKDRRPTDGTVVVSEGWDRHADQ